MKKVYESSKTNDIEQDYELREQLGSGTYSVVRLGINRVTKEEVAIKIMNKTDDEEELSALRGEIEIMRKIMDAQHVVRLQDVYETEDKTMLVLDLVVGGELFEKIVARGSYSEKDAAYALRQMMTALSQIHSKRIVHRDLKPENILCTSKALNVAEDIKIADFGESIELEIGKYTNELRGSPCYIAPEVWLQQDYDMASDMWSMGVIAFILLGGYLPFEEPEPAEDEEPDELRISEVIVRGEYTFHEDAWADTSKFAKDFVIQLLNVNPKQRMTSAASLAHPFLAQADEASTVSRNKAIANLKTFNARRKWKSVAQMVIATNRLKMLSGLTKKHRSKRSGAKSSKSKVTRSTSKGGEGVGVGEPKKSKYNVNQKTKK